MNLRHIDPRSTDWMDAMLEGESETKRKAEPVGQRERDLEGPHLLTGGKAATPESLASPPRTVSVTR